MIFLNNSLIVPRDTGITPLQILLGAIFTKYLIHSQCVTIISDSSLNIDFLNKFLYIKPNVEIFKDCLLAASETGYSDYVIDMVNAEHFVKSFDDVIHHGSYRKSDIKLIFICTNCINMEDNHKILEVLNMKQLKYIANVLLILRADELTSSDCEIFNLVTHKFEGPDDNVQDLVYLDKWNSCTRKFEYDNNLFPHNLQNLNGKIFRISTVSYAPYSILDLDTNKHITGRDGVEMKVVEEFCRKINCTIEVTADDGHQWGDVFNNETGVGVLGKVYEDIADIGFAALYAWYREYVFLDFSTPCLKATVSILVPAARVLSSWMLPVLPFSWQMWLGLVFAFFYASLALFLARGCSIINVFLSTFGMMVTQSMGDAGTTWKIRRVTGWLLLTGLVLDNAYAGGLASTLTVPKFEPSYDTMQDMIDRQLPYGATHESWMFSLYLSPDPKIQKFLQYFQVLPTEVLTEKSRDRSMGFILESIPGGAMTLHDYIPKDAAQGMELLLEPVYFSYCVFVLRKSSPYTDEFNRLILSLQAYGFPAAWETQVLLTHMDFRLQSQIRMSRFNRKLEQLEPLNLRQTIGIFLMLTGGVIISTMLFIGELLWKNNFVLYNYFCGIRLYKY